MLYSIGADRPDTYAEALLPVVDAIAEGRTRAALHSFSVAQDAAFAAEWTLDRLRALVREHPASEVPVIELAELARILGMEPPS
jgi:hypothetical protein